LARCLVSTKCNKAMFNLKPKIMKNLSILIATAFISTYSISASAVEETNSNTYAYGYGDSFIFVEDGITFSVYPDGEFDFYIDNVNYIGANVNLCNTNISFNSGFSYDAYVQYDDYGAVLHTETTPIYDDYDGRVSHTGSVDIYYKI